MSARLCWLRALLLAACLPFFSGAERDPLPVALTELLKSGSVSSTDLELLLLSDSVDDDPESYHANNTNNRLPRSLLDAQPAQQAQCKVRTEVMEVTRTMLDRSNANFLLWPPCVEVQRCSGCCNTKNLKCVPILTHTRYLQVMKIQYANTRPVYNKAIVSVNDHIECRCQTAPRPAARKKSPANKHEGRDRSGRGRHKDELKKNEGLKIEDLLSHSWLPIEKHSESVEDFGHDPWSLNKTHHGGSKGHYHGVERKYNGSFSSTRLTAPLSNHTKREETNNKSQEKEQPYKNLEIQSSTTIVEKHKEISPTEIANQIPLYESDLKQGGSLSKSSESSQVPRNDSHSKAENHEHSEQTNQTYGLAKVTDPKQGQVLSLEEDNKSMKGNETPESEKTSDEAESREETRNTFTLQKERKALEEEKEELLLLHKRLDEEKHKHSLKAPQHSEQPHHKQQHIYTTTQKTETTRSTTARVSTPPPPPRPPPRPQKRWRKHRNRISKAVMRAMLM